MISLDAQTEVDRADDTDQGPAQDREGEKGGDREERQVNAHRPTLGVEHSVCMLIT